MSKWNVSYRGITNAGVEGGIAVVVDVMRAFTTAAWAFELGVERIVMVDSLEEALQVKERLPDAIALKDGEPAPGFELVNSPAMLRRRGDLAGKTIVQRTTAGTVGAVAARRAEALFCASFVCAAATAEMLRLAGAGQVTFIVTGSDGTAEEDRACAEYIAALLHDPQAEPAPFLEMAAASRSAELLAQRVKAGSRGTDPDDVCMTLEVNRFAFAMRAREEDGLLVLRPEALV